MHEANAAHSILNFVIKTLSALGSPCSEDVLLYSFIPVGPVVKSPGKCSFEEDHYEEKQTSVHFLALIMVLSLLTPAVFAEGAVSSV